jgi:hypothetical protein
VKRHSRKRKKENKTEKGEEEGVGTYLEHNDNHM